jgi:hypothetical protein
MVSLNKKVRACVRASVCLCLCLSFVFKGKEGRGFCLSFVLVLVLVLCFCFFFFPPSDLFEFGSNLGEGTEGGSSVCLSVCLWEINRYL